jgi:glycerophosphoryl diester phosphodiesterase
MDGSLWLERRVIAYAHLGGSWEGPSSTLHAMRAALAAGATAIELDVHATADRELVVCHDATLERTTDGEGPIAAHTLAEVGALDNAYWFTPGGDPRHDLTEEDYPLRGRARKDPALRVATLREVLETFPDVVLNLDIKQTEPAVEPYEDLLVELLAAFERHDDVIVASFHDHTLDRLRALGADTALAAGPRAITAFWQAVHSGAEPPVLDAVALQVPERFGQLVVVDEAFVTAAHRQGLAVHVWTVNDAASMARLVELGVDGIMTDVPTTLTGVLEERGVGWQPRPAG